MKHRRRADAWLGCGKRMAELSASVIAAQSCMTGSQNRKYRCAIGSFVAGSQVSNSPSARTS